MRLTRLRARGYRSLADFELEIRPLNVLIGANAAGKSTVLDALRFLQQAVAEGSFQGAVAQRGSFVHLAWKGKRAERITLETAFVADDEQPLEWVVTLEWNPKSQELVVGETLHADTLGSPPKQLLDTMSRTWWWSDKHQKVDLALVPHECALAAASANADFRGRPLAEFVRSWSFFDPHPLGLRRASLPNGDDRLVMDGSNLAARLHRLQQGDRPRFDRILAATRKILGLPKSLEFRVSEDTGRVHFVQEENGLDYRVHQVGTSSGTLRLLAMATALLGSDMPSLIGLEEPENHLHPQAIDGFVQLLQHASQTHQVLVTTHWPGLLDGLDPASVCVVRRGDDGTKAERPQDPAQIEQALRESGFGLGEFFESTGFGA